MNWFHVTIHGRPGGVAAGPMTKIGGLQLATFAVPPGSAAEPLPVSFDEAVAKLADLPRMFVEPDGSFVWTASGPPPWQLDGMLYDQGDRLAHVEVKGTCPTAELVRLLALVGGGARRR